MHNPTRTDFKTLAAPGKIVPIYRQLMADTLTPVLAYSRLRNEGLSFLLESVSGGEKIGRYSFLGFRPSIIFKSSGQEVFIQNRGGESRNFHSQTPIDELESILAGYDPVHLPELPRFSGGAVGYFAYDVVRQVENLPNIPAHSLGLPDIYFGIYDEMLVFDHVNKTCKVVVYADCREVEPEEAYNIACGRIDDIVNTLSAPTALLVEEVAPPRENELAVTSNFERETFEDCVRACKEYVAAGDIFQVVLSQRLEASCKASPFEIYRALRVINPSPYMFCLEYPDFSLIGSSPEVMVRVEDRAVTVRPIAGTRHRGKNEEEDQALGEELLADEKERAEHTMLLDLGRNDVGRVSDYGSVQITEEMVIERYSHVMHIVSNVTGRLQEGCTAFDALKACMPAGTLSGAPKVRAMEIIDECEPDVRGPYGGAVGYVDFSGNMDTCITIRTILLKDGHAYVQAGAGLVADSVPASEYVETRNKAAALLRAIQAAEDSVADENPLSGGAERRRYIRVLADLPVRFPDLPWEHARTSNISIGGALVVAERTFEENEEVALEIIMPDGKSPLHLKASVCRCQGVRPVFVALNFVSASIEARTRIKAFVEDRVAPTEL